MTESDNKHLLDQDYLDAPDEFESDVDDLNDFDDGDDGGIFSAEGAKEKKKPTFKILAGAFILAVLAGGGFYLYSQLTAIKLSTNIASGPVDAPSNAVPSDIPAVPTTVSDFVPEMPQGANPVPTVPDITLDQTAQASVGAPSNTQPEALPVIEGQQDDGSNAVVETSVVQESSIEDSIISEKPPTVVQPPQVEEKVPDNAVLSPVQQTPIVTNNDALPVPKKNELEKARETINVAKKQETEKTVYFDAPKGKALLDIPPPSINAMQEPGESIIIVHKANKVADAIIEKGDESGFVESKLINAQRASGLGFNDSALEFYNELYKKNPRDPRILMGRAVTLQKLGETQKAINAYGEVLDVQPENPEALTNLMGLMGKTQPAVAMQNLLELREKYPKNAVIAAQLGIAYSESGNLQDGLRYLNIAAGLQPKNPLHYYNIAIICERLNDRANAIKYYEQALDIYSINGISKGTEFSREKIYDRLANLRGN